MTNQPSALTPVSAREPSLDETPTYLIGIGASSGGVPALKTFLQAIPAGSDFCIALVMHFNAERESSLDQLLARWTDLEVIQVHESLPLRKNCLYLIPPGANLTAIDSHLRLSPLEQKRVDRSPIDHFFHTLAETHEEHAIAVILTGAGVDGTQGARSIKEHGGFVIVQDPKEAEVASMPRSVCEAKIADCILPINQIPGKILEIQRAKVKISEALSEGLSDAHRIALQKIIAQVRIGHEHDFNDYKEATLLRRLRRRMQILQVGELDEYLEILRRDKQEVRVLFDDWLITVTDFFRDPDVFDCLESEVIPGLFTQKSRGGKIRIWIAGCATGEEAYTYAILLDEYASTMPEPPEILIFASDIHEPSLAKAREAIYPASIATRLSKERLDRYFSQVDDGNFQVKKELRELVIFAHQSMLRDPPFSRLDLISCRNVLIYLKPETQSHLLSIFQYALNPGAFLVLGSAESVDNSERFRSFRKDMNIYRRHSVTSSHPSFPNLRATPRHSEAFSRMQEERVASIPYGKMHQHMVERFGPPSILVSGNQDIVHYSEHAGIFLSQPGGEPTNNLFRRIREELKIEMRTCLFEAAREKRMTASKPVTMEFDGKSWEVVLRVSMAGGDSDGEDYFLVLFDQQPVRPTSQEPDNAAQDSRLIEQLEKDLADTRKRLQVVIEEYETSQEEMRSSNEELQSTNEELRSAMEELETGKEELQSVNEELSTVNEENRRKVEEFRRLTSDLSNVLAATDIATIFLNRQLRIMRFTPQASILFKLRQEDIGRPITDLNHLLIYEGLGNEARRVLSSLERMEQEVQDREGKWYQFRILPYLTVDDRIEGLVLTLVDISRIKIAEEDAVHRGEELASLAATLEDRVEERTLLIRQLSAQLTLAEQLERDRIAAMLHDDMQQLLCGIQMELRGLRDLKDPVRHEQLLTELDEYLHRAVDLTRHLTVDLSLPADTGEGFAVRLAWLCEQVKSRHKLNVQLETETPLREVDESVSILALQIVRELLFNIVKHAEVDVAHLTLKQEEDRLLINVRDGGKGFDPALLDKMPAADREIPTGMGLMTLRRRLSLLDGDLDVQSSEGNGCSISLKLPNSLDQSSG